MPGRATVKPTMRLALASLLLIATAGCKDTLVVQNLSSPDVDRVFKLPVTIEQTIGTGYQSCRNATYGSDRLQQMETMALESYSQLNNFTMGPRGAIPRGPILSSRTAPSNFTPFSALSRQARSTLQALDALNVLLQNGGTLGTNAQNLRARAWGFFVTACDLGYLALTYDSSAVVTLAMSSDSVPPLSGAKDVMAAAIAFLDSAVRIGQDAASGGTGGFPTPTAWLSGATLSRDNFVRWTRSWRARLRAANARTPEERNALDWDAIIADAENGLTADVVVGVGGSTGWGLGWIGSQMHVDAAWSQLSPMIWGMADTSGGYDTFLSKAMGDRDGYFLIMTPDQRFPQGATRALQQASSKKPASYLSRPYVENRSLTDTPGDPWGASFYNYFRYRYYTDGSNQGQFPEFLKTEVDLLAAEGYLRKGNIAAAAAKIDLSRVARGGLPALTGAVTSINDPVPGGAGCVPRVPQPPNYNTAGCGNVFEAMKWERRVELAFQQFGAWFYDARGWGDLPVDTALQYPTPYQELDARQLSFWSLGGGGPSSAKKGTYGF
jgi:hypothetical protein